MIKSAPTMVTKLHVTADYQKLKAWQSAVEAWVLSHMQIYPDKLGPSAVRTVARMTLSAELYTALEGDGALGIRGKESEAETRWDVMMEHLRERLGCTRVNLKIGLARLQQEGRTMKEFARQFERRAVDAEVLDEDAKILLISALNMDTL